MSSPLEELRKLAAPDADRTLRLAVLAAHPDDESIGASIVLARFPQTRVIFLTDGAPRDLRLWPPNMASTREDYAATRRHEAREALGHAGATPAQLYWLGGIDQESIVDALSLAERLAQLLEQLRPDLLITHPYEGGHPDHDCAALVARLALQKLPAEFNAPTLCEMTSYHARDGQCITGEFLNSDPASEIVLDLTDADRERKRRMMSEYKSQRLVLKGFPIVAERLRIAPTCDFTDPPHEGELWYENMGWTTGDRWRRLAARACARMQECSCP